MTSAERELAARGLISPVTNRAYVSEPMTVGEVIAAADKWRHLAKRRQEQLDALLELLGDAESSGRSTVLIENVRRVLGAL